MYCFAAFSGRRRGTVASSIFRVVAEAILRRAALNGHAEGLESLLARNEWLR